MLESDKVLSLGVWRLYSWRNIPPYIAFEEDERFAFIPAQMACLPTRAHQYLSCLHIMKKVRWLPVTSGTTIEQQQEAPNNLAVGMLLFACDVW